MLETLQSQRQQRHNKYQNRDDNQMYLGLFEQKRIRENTSSNEKHRLDRSTSNIRRIIVSLDLLRVYRRQKFVRMKVQLLSGQCQKIDMSSTIHL